jgi:hypothetical protein
MANHRVRFTLGSHIQFGSLDFFCMGMDHDLVLLPPSVLVNLVSPSGSNEHVEDLDPTGIVGECILPSPTELLDSPANINSIIGLIVGLCLHANEVQASGGAQPHGFDPLRLERQLDAILGPCHPRKISIASILSLQSLVIALRGPTALHGDKHHASATSVALRATQCCEDL